MQVTFSDIGQPQIKIQLYRHLFQDKYYMQHKILKLEIKQELGIETELTITKKSKWQKYSIKKGRSAVS